MKKLIALAIVFSLAACADAATDPAPVGDDVAVTTSQGAIIDPVNWYYGGFIDADGDQCFLGTWDSQGKDDYIKQLPNGKTQYHGSAVVPMRVIPFGGQEYTGDGTATYNVTFESGVSGITGVFMARGKVMNADGDKGQAVCRTIFKDNVRVMNEVDLH